MRRSFLALITSLAFLPAAAVAQPFPDRPVRLVIPYPAGGSLDVIGRPVAQHFQEVTGQPLVLDNRGGANGTIAADHVAKSRPDGYTLLLASAGPVTIAPALHQNTTYDPRTDLTPVSLLINIPFTLFSAASFPARDLTEVVAAARAKPNAIPFGSPGNGSIGHLALEMMAQATGTRWMHVPYRGASLVLNDMAAGTISLTFTTIASAKPMVDSGRLRPIAVAAPTRTAAMPELPTFAELGFPQVEAPLWVGVMAPAGTPAPVVARLNELFLDAMASPTVRATMAGVGGDILAKGPDGFAAMLHGDFARWAEVVRRGNITIN